MRIAFVLHDYNRVLGHSRYVTELAERFAPAHDVHVFANTFADVRPGVTRHHVPAIRTTALTTILSFYAAATVRVGRGFDIVHAQGAVVASADIVTAHISNAQWLEGRRNLEGGRLSWRERLFASLVTPLERRTFGDDRTTVVAVSRALAADIERSYGRSAETVVIHHGVDLAQFNPGVGATHRDEVRAALGIGREEIVHLFVGDLRKGFSLAIAALATAPGRLVAISRSDPSAMREAAERQGVGSRVTILPPTDRIERYYGAADTFVFPTPYDAFGMVITEAMACGLPVITTAAAGASEIIVPGRTGVVLASPVAVPALAADMRRLATDAEARRQIGSAAATAMRTESWDTVASRTMAVYERLRPASTTVAASPSS